MITLHNRLPLRRPAAQDGVLVGSHDGSAETLAIHRARDTADHRDVAGLQRTDHMRAWRHAPTVLSLICNHSIRHSYLCGNVCFWVTIIHPAGLSLQQLVKRERAVWDGYGIETVSSDCGILLGIILYFCHFLSVLKGLTK